MDTTPREHQVTQKEARARAILARVVRILARQTVQELANAITITPGLPTNANAADAMPLPQSVDDRQ